MDRPGAVQSSSHAGRETCRQRVRRVSWTDALADAPHLRMHVSALLVRYSSQTEHAHVLSQRCSPHWATAAAAAAAGRQLHAGTVAVPSNRLACSQCGPLGNSAHTHLHTTPALSPSPGSGWSRTCCAAAADCERPHAPCHTRTDKQHTQVAAAAAISILPACTLPHCICGASEAASAPLAVCLLHQRFSPSPPLAAEQHHHISCKLCHPTASPVSHRSCPCIIASGRSQRWRGPKLVSLRPPVAQQQRRLLGLLPARLQILRAQGLLLARMLLLKEAGVNPVLESPAGVAARPAATPPAQQKPTELQQRVAQPVTSRQ